MVIVLNETLVPGKPRKFAFKEKTDDTVDGDEPGLTQFLGDTALSGDVSADEIEFLRTLKFRRKRPNALYYYRELQNLRDPLHFQSAPG